ncbi:hypothetical protein [Pluralibacter gergoviae]|uniref:hypothetical protein n=1 Tax=Pluralibacter gergoviae TaxID=61647 RepID=UPI0006BFBB13|nr:hypothetical protein [Pluralibacter gergoviae]KOQ95785.1 hypothetical protein ABW48_16220 [Pluralibacter gergoviae]
MNKPTIYTVAHPEDLSPPVANQGFCVDVVLASDYAELQREVAAYEATVENLEAKVAALAAELITVREHASEVYSQGYNHGHLNTVDGIAYENGVEDSFYGNAMQIMAEVDTPATDAVIAEIRAGAVEHAANYLYGAGYICETLLAFAQQLRAEASK